MANLKREKKREFAREFAIPSSAVCPSILIQGPQRGCSEHRLFGVSIATATKLPLQRPPEGCVSTFHPLSRSRAITLAIVLKESDIDLAASPSRLSDLKNNRY